MLAANVCAAEYVAKNELPALYRNHEGPRDEKLSKLRNYLGALGIPFTAGKKPQPSDFQAVLEKIGERPDAHIIQTMLLRSLTQAVYSPNNLGHFGLAYEAYAHFTSPIRRYPDLLLHRVIRAKLRGERTVMQSLGDRMKRLRGQKLERDAATIVPDMAQMLAFGEHCSMTERRADEATRDVMAWLKCEYMQEHIGEEFDGVIAGVTSFGFFVELTDIYVEGLVHISNLKGDYYDFDATMQKLVGSRSGTQFALGDTVRIKVAAVNMDQRKMDFELIDGGSTLRRGGPRMAATEMDNAPRGKGRNTGGKSSSGSRSDRAPAKSGGGKPGGSKSGGGKAGAGKSDGKSVRDRLRSGDIPGKDGGKGGDGDTSKSKKPVARKKK